ncbi:DegT/DnrJ/EryC1/StrS family aminotransferase [Aquisediminimonas sediminicola]|uniref:DegT/DnrJ/EryC1/StrS family aminotransferase n=1 Tax=Alteraquisediminimonas sediminicola TaxID=2676787 RepID=UPI001C8ED568|nr:DegT/DnrJ/EryC1/StrS family aminotransferase [Aquisediminimonas sediminicola]
MLPDLNDFHRMLGDIWQSKALTNCGPLHQQLERELQCYLDVPTAMLFNNGTIALLVALKLFDLPIGSEVITTPLTFAATAHAITWNGLKPVFVDVLPHTLTLDPAAVVKAITPRTSAILGVHVYGNVCEIEALECISKQYNLRLFFDAAHAFGVTVNGRSIASYGDASAFSFHATKLFNTLEGGLLATNRPEDAEIIYHLRNFGIKNEEEVVSVGINGKLNEMQAAIGLLNLPLVEEEKRSRAGLKQKYRELLNDLPGIQLPPEQQGVTSSEQYFPIVVDPATFGCTRDDLYDELKARQIFARKYFHPICTDFDPYKGFPIYSVRDTPFVDIIKNRVLCLPYHSGVDDTDLSDIISVFYNKNI